MKHQVLPAISALILIAGMVGASAQSGGSGGSSGAGSGASGGLSTGATSGRGGPSTAAPSAGGRSSFQLAPSGSNTTMQTSPLGGTGQSDGSLGQSGRTSGQPTTGPTGMQTSAPQENQNLSNSGSQSPGQLREHPSTPQQGAAQNPQFQSSGGKAKQGSIPGGALVALTEEERRKIRDIIVSQTAAQEPRANFRLMVGARVPRDVSLRPMPEEVVKAVPRYRDFDFTIVNGRIVVVQRNTREIDTMIPL
jgi:hypothetical protein